MRGIDTSDRGGGGGQRSAELSISIAAIDYRGRLE